MAKKDDLKAPEASYFDKLDLKKSMDEKKLLESIALSAKDKSLVEKYVNFRGYRGDLQLKRAGVEVEWTPELAAEYKRCADDPLYFLENHMKIISGDEGLILFKLRDYQKVLVSNMHNNRHTITVMARQSGKSTAVVGYLLWFILFNAYKTVLLLAQNAETAREILGKAQIAYVNLPKYIQQGVVDGGWNKGSMMLENGSRAIAMSTSDTAARGYTANILILDEAAHIERWEEFSTATLPTVSSMKTSKVFMISTPYGLNHFWAYYEKARLMNIPQDQWPPGMKWNSYVPLLVTWNMVPGRDAEWYEHTMMELNYDENKFNQEYNCEFMGSSGTLIAGKYLKLLMAKTPIAVNGAGMKKYEAPIPNHSYAITADTSEGKGLNHSAFHVTDISQMPYKQVAVFRSNTTAPGDFAETIVLTAEAYNHALILIEWASLGSIVVKDIWDSYEYDNILFTKAQGAKGMQVTHRCEGANFGLKMTEVAKKNGCLWLKLLVEQFQYVISDQDTIMEFQRFSKHNNTYKAEEGATDDLVMGLVVFAWLTQQDYFKNINNIDTLKELRDKTSQKLEEEIEPLGMLLWRQQNMPAMPTTAELHGLVGPQNDLWFSGSQPKGTDYSPYVHSNPDDMYTNPFERDDDMDNGFINTFGPD